MFGAGPKSQATNSLSRAPSSQWTGTVTGNLCRLRIIRVGWRNHSSTCSQELCGCWWSFSSIASLRSDSESAPIRLLFCLTGLAAAQFVPGVPIGETKHGVRARWPGKRDVNRLVWREACEGKRTARGWVNMEPPRARRTSVPRVLLASDGAVGVRYRKRRNDSGTLTPAGVSHQWKPDLAVRRQGAGNERI